MFSLIFNHLIRISPYYFLKDPDLLVTWTFLSSLKQCKHEVVNSELKISQSDVNIHSILNLMFLKKPFRRTWRWCSGLNVFSSLLYAVFKNRKIYWLYQLTNLKFFVSRKGLKWIMSTHKSECLWAKISSLQTESIFIIYCHWNILVPARILDIWGYTEVTAVDPLKVPRLNPDM